MPAGSRTYAFEKYLINHWAKGATFVNEIFLYESGPIVGYIRFFPKGQAPQSLVSSPPDSKFFLFYEIERYQEIIDTLRYEKPLRGYVAWDANNMVTQGVIGTGPEAIGEQEGAGVAV